MWASLVEGGELWGFLWQAATVLHAVMLAAVLGVVRHLPPAPLDAAAPVDRFSAGRAMPDIEAIARAPHPIGSAEHRRVREHIAGRLRALGFETIEEGKPKTPFMSFGDRVRIEMRDGDGASIFGSIDQLVQRRMPSA